MYIKMSDLYIYNVNTGGLVLNKNVFSALASKL